MGATTVLSPPPPPPSVRAGGGAARALAAARRAGSGVEAAAVRGPGPLRKKNLILDTIELLVIDIHTMRILYFSIYIYIYIYMCVYVL